VLLRDIIDLDATYGSEPGEGGADKANGAGNGAPKQDAAADEEPPVEESDDDGEDDEEAGMSLAAMELALKPRVLETFDQIAKTYKRFKKVQESRVGVARTALRAELAGRPMLGWASDMTEIAIGGLDRLATDPRDSESSFLAPVRRWLVTGGGRHNPVLMDGLARRTGVPVEPVEAVGQDGDALEARAFAYLAVRSLLGLSLSVPGTTGVRAPATGGQISTWSRVESACGQTPAILGLIVISPGRGRTLRAAIAAEPPLQPVSSSRRCIRSTSRIAGLTVSPSSAMTPTSA